MMGFTVKPDKRSLLLLALALLFGTLSAAFGPISPQNTVSAAGAVYYVGGTGASDSNTGSSSQPFATIQKASTMATAGDTVRIRSGTYRETITPLNSGTSGNPIVYEPDGDAVVTVSGADTADGGWSAHSGSIYKRTTTMTNGYNANMTNNTTLMANQVFVNGQMMIEARWPNLPDSNDLLNRNDYRNATLGTWSTSGSQTLNESGIPNISGGWTGGTIWVNGWFITQTRNITAHSGTTLTLSGDLIGPDFRKYYYLTGKLGALDSAKEFFYDGSQLYLWAPNGGSPTNVEVKKRNYAFELSGKSYITIRKIKLFAATINTNTSSTNITLDELNAKYINHSVTLTDSDVIYTHTGQIDTTVGSTGIRLLGANSRIEDSEISFSSGHGVYLGPNSTANNNLIHDIDYEGSYTAGIAPVNGTDGQTITNNTIYRTGRSSVDLLNSKNVTIAYNNLYDFGMNNIDLGAIYSARNADTTGLHIHHNWIHDVKAPTNGYGLQTGIYFDQNSGPSRIDHNVVYFANSGPGVGDLYVQHTAERNFAHEVYNNTFATLGGYTSYKNENSASPTTFDVMKNNIFRNVFHYTYIEYTPSGTNSLYRTTDPLFSSSGSGSLAFRLQSSSPAKDTGAVVSGVTTGYVGSAPDIGAYEYGGADWVTGYVAPTGSGGGTALHIEAESYNAMSGITNAGATVESSDAGDYVRYNGINLGSGYTTFTARYARGNTGTGSAEIRLDSTTGTLVGTLTTNSTGSWATFTTGTASLTGASGTHDVFIVFPSGSGTGNGNFDWFEFSGASTPPPSSTKYEAESAAFSGNIATATNHTGYSGSSFVNNYWATGDAVTFTVNAASAGSKDVSFRYANAQTAARTLSIYVNGTKIKQSSFPNLANWDTWGDKVETLSLNAGSNSIALKFDSGDTGVINLDYLSLPSSTPTTTKYEAESAAYSGSVATATNHTGYSGTGFAANFWATGDAVTFTVNATSAGSKDVTIHYANAQTTARTLSIYVNGTKIRQTSLANLANWDTWGDKIETLSLNAGNNTIALKFDSGDTGVVNVDYVSLTQ